MTSLGDYSDEMGTPGRVDDAVAEQLLGGDAADSVGGELAPLATVVHTLRAVAAQPVEPNPTLAARMASGVFPGPGERYEATRYRRPAHRPQGRGFGAAALARVKRWAGLAAAPRRRTVRGFAIRAGALAGLVVIGTGSAGFAGVLPEPVQQRFESVVESVTPYDFRGRSAGRVEPEPTRPQEGSGPGQPQVGGPSRPAPSGPAVTPGSGPPTDLPNQDRPVDPPATPVSQPGPPEGVPGFPEGAPGPPEGVPGPPKGVPGPPEGVPGPGRPGQGAG